MNLKKIFSFATLMSVVILGASCSKDNLVNDSDESVITLKVPAMPGFGDDAHSRTIFEDNGIKPIVKWKVGDPIYIGTVKDVADKTLFSALVEQGKFAEFKCTKVNEDGTALFEGTAIPTDADIAVYTKHLDKTMKWNQTVDGNKVPSIDNPCITTAPKANDNLEHLAENDLLLALFDSENKTFKEIEGVTFCRVHPLAKFIMNFPEGINGKLGYFLSVKGSGENSQLSMKGRVLPYNMDKNTNLPTVWGVSSGPDLDFKIDCSNLTIENNTVTLYSLFGCTNTQFKGKNLTFTMEVGDKTYTASIKAADHLNRSNYAIRFNLNFTEVNN